MRRLIEQSLKRVDGFTDHVRVVGKMDSFSGGVYHDNYRFVVADGHASSELVDQAMLIRLPKRQFDWQCNSAALKRLADEAETLKRLEQASFQMHFPRFVAEVREDVDFAGFIETFTSGLSFSKHDGQKAIQAIAKAAAKIHSLDTGGFPHLSSYTRRDHVIDWLNEIPAKVFDTFPEAVQAKSWIAKYLPENKPGCLLHGDLLPQNLLKVFDWETNPGAEPEIGIVDWEMARIGDPAYDLAIVSRGNRKICGIDKGRKKLLSAYLDNGGQPIAEADVTNGELILLLSWLRNSMESPDETAHSTEHHLNQLRALLRRLPEFLQRR